MVVKFESCLERVQDLEEIFPTLRRNNMRLNLEKCVRRVQEGKFLEFMLTHRGIEANPDKCKTIIDMHNANNMKEVQRLVGKLTTLSRFSPRLVEKEKMIIQLLEKMSRFHWDSKCEDIFGRIKEFFASPPIIQKMIPLSYICQALRKQCAQY